MKYKRDNWTNEEILSFLEGNKLADKPNPTPESKAYIDQHNSVVDDMKSIFYDFMRSQEEMGAMAYNTEEKSIVHIGAIDESSKIIVRSRPCPHCNGMGWVPSKTEADTDPCPVCLGSCKDNSPENLK